MGFGGIGVTAGGYVAAAILLGLWLNARDAIIEEREGCNTKITQAALASEKLAREATREAYERRLADIEAQLTREQNARRIASEGRLEADSRAEAAIARLNAIIRDIEETENAPVGQICAATDVPADIRSVYSD